MKVMTDASVTEMAEWETFQGFLLPGCELRVICLLFSVVFLGIRGVFFIFGLASSDPLAVISIFIWSSLGKSKAGLCYIDSM